MAKSDAERQAALRERRKRQAIGAENGEGAGQINLFVKASARNALRRMSRHQGTSQRAVLEQLLMEAEDRLTAAMTDEESGHYMRVTE